MREVQNEEIRIQLVGVDHDGYLTDEEDIARRGEVTADDRVEVQPWIEKEERFSFVSSDPRAIDLDCFKHLAKREA